jgi:3-oxoadipate enol-lactonase
MIHGRTVLIEGAPRLAAEVMGQGELLVFLHGIGGNRHQWERQMPAFASTFCACAFDARGYGDSEDYPGSLKFAALADDVLRVLEYFGYQRAHLVGHSMGGRIARSFALKYPDRVSSLVLANTSGGFDALTPEQVRAFVRDRKKPLLAGKTPADIAPDLVKRLIGKAPRPGVVEESVRLIEALHVESYLKTIDASVEEDRTASLEALTVPVLVIASEEDPLYAPDLCRKMAARISGAQFLIIPRAGHLSNLEQPEHFNASVLAFLQQRKQAAKRG